MFQTRIHGRGGQGVVSGAEMLSFAAFLEGRYAQAFPSFGSERMGAPVMAFCRIDDREVRLREPVLDPDGLIVQDPTLLHQVELFKGVRSTGYLLINSSRDFTELGLGAYVRSFRPERVATVPATEIALTRVGRPVPNAALLGGFSALTGIVRLESIIAAIRDKFPKAIAERNAAAADEAFAHVQKHLETQHA